jgi:hypothetical protein
MKKGWLLMSFMFTSVSLVAMRISDLNYPVVRGSFYPYLIGKINPKLNIHTWLPQGNCRRLVEDFADFLQGKSLLMSLATSMIYLGIITLKKNPDFSYYAISKLPDDLAVTYLQEFAWN